MPDEKPQRVFRSPKTLIKLILKDLQSGMKASMLIRPTNTTKQSECEGHECAYHKPVLVLEYVQFNYGCHLDKFHKNTIFRFFDRRKKARMKMKNSVFPIGFLVFQQLFQVSHIKRFQVHKRKTQPKGRMGPL
jgi:hypothetical protein